MQGGKDAGRPGRPAVCNLDTPPGGGFLLRLESTTVVCFVGVTANSVSGVLRLELPWLAASVDLLVTYDEENKRDSTSPLFQQLRPDPISRLRRHRADRAPKIPTGSSESRLEKRKCFVACELDPVSV